MNIKFCPSCKKNKSVDSFSKDRSTKCGLRVYCKECLMDKYKNKSTVRKEYMKQMKKEYRVRNRERFSLYDKKRYRENPKRRMYLVKTYEKWRKNNPKKHNQKGLRRRYLMNGGNFSESDWNELKKEFGYECACCREKKELTIDHIIPLSKGGLHIKENIQPLCRICNCKKGTKTIKF